MRRLNKAIAATFLMVAIISVTNCKKDVDPNLAEFKIVTEYLDVKATSASITGSFEYPGKINSIKVAVGQRHDFTDAHRFLADIHEKEFEVTLTGLTTGTEYRYRYEVDYGASKPYTTEAKTFTTQSESPTVKTLEVLAIDSTTYRIKCEVLADGGQEVTERGICWNTFGDPTMDDGTLQHSTGGLGQYTIRMENLALGKKYYVRAYAKNAAGIGLSEEVLDFETEAPTGASVDIELSCNPEEGGTASGGGSYEVGTQCTVKAVANSGYTFVNWTENGNQVSSEATYTFAVTAARNLVANFTEQAYIITAQIDPEDSGTVTGAGGYNYGEECTLTATAKTGYDFVKWTKGGGTTVSTDAEYSFNVTATATYVAHFRIKSFSVSVSANPTNGGTVSGGGTFNYGESRTVHATPADGFAFTNWTDDDDIVSEEANYSFSVTSNRTLVANFTVLQPDEYSITVSANPSNGGTVTGGGTYQQGQSCTVTATSKPGFAFVNWTENGNQVSDLAEYTFTVTGNRIFVANFEIQAPTEYTVSASANPSNGGSVTGSGTYQQGQQCTVTATANEGYTFANWTEGGDVVSAQASYTFIVNNNRILEAQFQAKSYTISVSANPTDGGSVFGDGNYNYGQSCTVSATAASGYTFTNWTENGSVISTNANYTFTVNADRTLMANFLQKPTGAIGGLFSVNSTHQVWFSQGNLQYNAVQGSHQCADGTTKQGTWRFATNQWYYIGQSNENISQNYNGWIDLFGWGTSGWNYGNPWDYDGWSGPPDGYDLTGAYANSDWGHYNAINNGGNQTGQWRTLTGSTAENDGEWYYVLFARSASTVNGIANARYVIATVNGVRGVVLFPDSYTHPSVASLPVNINQPSYNLNNWLFDEWTAMEDAGAVFLPAAGYRSGIIVEYDGLLGCYWSSQCASSGWQKKDVQFGDGFSSSYPNPIYGFSVRLVRNANY